MKKIALLALSIVSGLVGTSKVQAAFVSTNLIPLQIQITAVVQATNNPVPVTNSTGVVTTTYKATTNHISTTNLIQILATEFGTNLPANAKLCYRISGGSGFIVADPNGNPLLDVSSNPSDSSYVFVLSNNVVHSFPPQVAIGKQVEKPASTNLTETIFQPDYGVFYKDGQGNDFHFSGMLKLTANAIYTNGTTTYSTLSFGITGGSGGGRFYSAKNGAYLDGAFLRADLNAAAKNISQ